MSNYRLVNEKQFVAATRDTGYRSTSAAVAELVDNALQAQARSIRITLREDRKDTDREIKVAVADDGCGMTPEEVRRALQWAGSSRFNDRSGLGRFGMGLPNSSVSQARRVEVYAWNRGKKPHVTYLDLDEIEGGRLREVPKPVPCSVPDWIDQTSASGTVVVWSRCDRLDYKKATTLERKLQEDLGRIFRHPLWEGVEIVVNESYVEPNDPLFIRPPMTRGVRASEPMPPLRFPIRLQDGTVTEVVARFSLLPIEEWHDLCVESKRALGIVGGAGVSVLRAGREIAHGWFFMNGKKRQNYDDWWRVEIDFQPPLDELMGVTHSKQGIRPTSELGQILAPDVGAIARDLSARVRDQFVRLAKQGSEAASRAEGREWRLPRVPVESRPFTVPSPSSRMEHLQYDISFADSPELDFFSWSREGSELQLQINENHPFYRAFYRPVTEAGLEWVRAQVELMLLALARAEISENPEVASSLRTRWSDVVATFLGE